MILPQSHETQSGNERLFAHAANEAIKVVGVRSQLPGLLFGEFVASLESLRDASVLDFEPLLPAIDIALGAAAKQSYRKVLDDSRLPEEVFPRSSHVVNAAIIGEKVLSVGQFRKSNAASPSGNSAVKAQLALKQLYEKAVSASGKNARDRVAELSERHIETGVNKDDVRAAYDEVVHGMCTQILETAYAAAGELEEVKKGFLRTIFGKRTLVDTSVNSGPNANRVLKEAIGLIESFMANPEKFMTQKIVEALRDKVKQKSSQTAVSDIEAILRNELTLLSKKLGTITLRGILLKEEKQERSPAIVSGTDAADVGKKNVLLETEQATEANVEPTKLESRSFGNASIIAEWLADDEKQREVVVYTLPDGKTIAVVDARTRASKNLTADATHQNKPVAEAFQSDLANILKYVCAGNEERFGVIWDTREGYPDIIKRFGNNKPNAPRTYFVTDVFSNVVDSKNLTDEMRAACPPETPVVLIIGQVTKKMQLAQLSLLQNTSIAALRRSGAGSV